MIVVMQNADGTTEIRAGVELVRREADGRHKVTFFEGGKQGSATRDGSTGITVLDVGSILYQSAPIRSQDPAAQPSQPAQQAAQASARRG